MLLVGRRLDDLFFAFEKKKGRDRHYLHTCNILQLYFSTICTSSVLPPRTLAHSSSGGSLNGAIEPSRLSRNHCCVYPPIVVSLMQSFVSIHGSSIAQHASGKSYRVTVMSYGDPCGDCGFRHWKLSELLVAVPGPHRNLPGSPGSSPSRSPSRSAYPDG